MKQLQIEGDLIPSVSKICGGCSHWNPLETTCKAFPEGIPMEIWMGENPHTAPYPGDNGIQFQDVRKPALAEAS